MKFLEKIVEDLLSKFSDLSQLNIVLPGKRPLVFINRILKEKSYNGMLPQFSTIEDLIQELAAKQHLQGIALHLFAYKIYQNIDASEDFGSFLKWFPTLQKDWDDMLKFTDDNEKVLQWMLDEERIKNWGEDLGEEDNARRRNLNFWKKMNAFLPLLKTELDAKNWATSGMIHVAAKEKIQDFAKDTPAQFIFCGFNAFTPIEESVVKNLLHWDKAICYFQADSYYIEDERQEAGKFLREHLKWKEFNDSRVFNWIENDFQKSKNINVYEVSGNIVQTKVLPKIFENIALEDISKTAVILLDENLLPASLDAMSQVKNLNITMGFPLKNLSFSNAIKKLFYLQKQLEKKASSYYYADIFPILQELPNSDEDQKIINDFIATIESRNIVYISSKMIIELLGELSYFSLLKQPNNVIKFLDDLIKFCTELKFRINDDDILYENISHFEQSFRVLKNQIEPYKIPLKMETLEVLINQLVNTESIDFQGEPLAGLQVMGLLESRLLNFENLILLSVNEGKLPLGNTQNTYLPFDVRKNFGLNTFLENDSIYAYHFYRLIQDSKNVHLLFNALSSGVNTGEKSRFITQIEMESAHKINHIVVDNASEPIVQELMKIEKTESVLEKLQEWKQSVSASHLTSYLYNPVDFYLKYVLKVKDTDEIEEELSVRNYGNLVHFAVQYLYEDFKNKILTLDDFKVLKDRVEASILHAIKTLKHEKEFYERGMNYVHRQIAERVIRSILQYDENLVKNGSSLEIIELEKNVKAEFFINAEKTDSVMFNGFIDRIDRLDGVVRIIDYKTAKIKKLNLKVKDKTEQLETLFYNEDYKQALQLSIYKYVLQQDEDYNKNVLEPGIWSFAEVNKGVASLTADDLDDSEIEFSIASLINLILNPEIPFEEKEHTSW
ncbi:PD-(D/E)XK nuclease family protein [Chryseobacterium sp. POL2]|uniref:PD-(D/E)XK nuclease family protein n=1 Tax=Chryseobacterium sp. POL2 TaxID=2713414 RepID=UPI0013E101AF|nr:PD-(D/E)XK nuclease family protein [Chryseobacterium sp. POL2]QIG88765.1 PD-(D/E)XK nuclease family protein [Chryseobacterium sp. POL2]